MFHHSLGFYQITTKILGFSLLLLCLNHFSTTTKTSIRLKKPIVMGSDEEDISENAVIKIIEIMMLERIEYEIKQLELSGISYNI